MTGVNPWISVEPGANGPAILGPLPFAPGSVAYPLPTSVVPDGAQGILVFAWVTLSGVNPAFAYWHCAVNTGAGNTMWFSMLIAGDPTGNAITSNSQAFWLPMPVDRLVTVTLFANAPLSSPTNQGEVEIHGYLPPSLPNRPSP